MKKVKLTIKHKLILAGALALASMLSILGLGLYTSSELKVYGDISTAIVKVESNMLMLRRNEKDFLARKTLKYQTKFEKNFSIIQSNVDVLAVSLMAGGLDTQSTDSLHTTLLVYKTIFNKVVELQKKIGLHPKDGLYGSLRQSVHAAETQIKSLNDQHLRADMLQLRRNEKDFMLRHTLKYLKKFNKNIDVFNKDLLQSPHTPAVKASLQTLIKQYAARFAVLVKNNQDKGLSSKEGLMGEMRGTIHKTETILSDLSKELNATVESQVGSIDGLMIKTMVFALLLAIGVTAIIAWIAMGILRPLLSLTKMMGKAADENDLSLRAEVNTEDEIGETGSAFNHMLERFQDIVGQVNSSANQISTAAEELSSVTRENLSEIQDQSLQTDQVATAITEMSATVQEVAANAEAAARSANESVQQANEGREVVNSSIVSMNSLATEIEQASTVIHGLEEDGVKIGAVLDVIRGIAEQTNLLALNAAIEAARAGEQGRGFAVVADEVRTLASRTQESTQEIQQMIESLQSGTAAAVNVMDSSRTQAQSGVEKISSAGNALSAIVSGINQINDMNTQIASAAEEQSAVSEEINRNVVKISESSVNTTNNSSRTQSASEELSNLSMSLKDLVSQFKT